MRSQRSSRPWPQAGAIAVGVVLLLLVAAGLLALLLLHEQQPAAHKRVDRTRYVEEPEQPLPDNGFRMVWRAREDGTGAPTVAFLLRPTDVAGWSRAHSPKVRSGPTMDQEVLVPSVDSLNAAPGSGPSPCTQAATPFAGCLATGTATLTMSRGESTGELYRALEELRLPRFDSDARARTPPRRELRFFRTQPDAQGRRVEILDDGAGQGERAVLLLTCKGDCEAHFLYKKRLMRLNFTHVPAGAEDAMRMRLFRSAWEMLNRQHADAYRPYDAGYEHADARLQMEVCRGNAREAARWAQGSGYRDSRTQDLWHRHFGRSCQRVEQLALRFAKTDAELAASLLRELLPVYHEARLSVDRALYEAQFALLRQRGREQSEEMLDAMAGVLRHDALARFEGGEDLPRRALELAIALELRMTDPRMAVIRERVAAEMRRRDDAGGIGGSFPGR